jgi:outer membrane protein TolC
MRKSIALLPALAAASHLFAQPAPGASADLAQMLREAETSHPSLRAAAARLEAARRRPAQAAVRPDPVLSVGYVNDGVSQFTLGDSEFSWLSLTWEQELPYPGKLELSHDVAAAEADEADRRLEGARFEVRWAVLAGYAELYRLDRTRVTLEQTRAALDSLAQAARRRYEVGEGIQESVLKAQTEIMRLEVQLARLEEDRRAAQARLNAAIGRDGNPPIGEVTALPSGSLPDDLDGLVDEALHASPGIAGLQAATRRAGLTAERARLNQKPDFNWSASYQYRGGLDPMVAGLFGVSLPVHRKTKQAEAVAQAEAEKSAAEQDLAALRVTTRGSVLELASRAERAARLATLFEQGVMPPAQGALESAQASYAVGRLDFPALLNDLLAVLNVRTELAEQQAERIKALAALEPLLDREMVTPSQESAR